MRFRVCAQQQHGPRPPLVYSCSVLAHVPARRFSSNLFFVSLVFLNPVLTLPSPPHPRSLVSAVPPVPPTNFHSHSCTCLRAALHYYVPPDLRVLDKQSLTLFLLSRISEAYSSKNHNPVISFSIHLDRSLDSHQVQLAEPTTRISHGSSARVTSVPSFPDAVVIFASPFSLRLPSSPNTTNIFRPQYPFSSIAQPAE